MAWLTFFGIMLALAALPGSSVALVVTRSAVGGVRSGLAVAAGIVLADLLFVSLVMLGLTVLAETLGGLFTVVKYLAAGYLLWLGVSLLRQAPAMDAAKAMPESSSMQLASSFLAGLLLTLADIKALFFYLSLFPLVMDVQAIQPVDMLAVWLITLVTVGGIKVAYALSAARIARLPVNQRLALAARRTAGGLMIGSGVYLLAKP